MPIAGATKEMLLRLKKRLPADKQDRFVGAIRNRLSDLECENTVYGALLGGALGALMEALPGVETITGIDDWVEVGAALGAWRGYVQDKKEREQREKMVVAIKEALHETFT